MSCKQPHTHHNFQEKVQGLHELHTVHNIEIMNYTVSVRTIIFIMGMLRMTPKEERQILGKHFHMQI